DTLIDPTSRARYDSYLDKNNNQEQQYTSQDTGQSNQRAGSSGYSNDTRANYDRQSSNPNASKNTGQSNSYNTNTSRSYNSNWDSIWKSFEATSNKGSSINSKHWESWQNFLEEAESKRNSSINLDSIWTTQSNHVTETIKASDITLVFDPTLNSEADIAARTAILKDKPITQECVKQFHAIMELEAQVEARKGKAGHLDAVAKLEKSKAEFQEKTGFDGLETIKRAIPDYKEQIQAQAQELKNKELEANLKEGLDMLGSAINALAAHCVVQDRSNNMAANNIVSYQKASAKVRTH
ncbi:MAG: hypothetical protein WCJ33_07170, partial [Pseudomonadota bacterium]